MNKITTEQYREGIQSLLNFLDMLEVCLEKAMDGVELRYEAAYAWQGFQIERYQGLKDSQYYCQFYQGRPHILEFFEYYEMTHYPFMRKLDLLEKGFFSLSYAEQEQMIIQFIKNASDEAVIWNSSQERRNIVPQKYW